MPSPRFRRQHYEANLFGIPEFFFLAYRIAGIIPHVRECVCVRVCASTFNIICTRDATQITLRTKPAECNYRRMMEVLFFFSVLLADAGWPMQTVVARYVCSGVFGPMHFGSLAETFCWIYFAAGEITNPPTHPPTTTRAHVPISSGRTENRIKTHVRTDTVCVASNFEKNRHTVWTQTHGRTGARFHAGGARA